jgi:hypothetical protein
MEGDTAMKLITTDACPGWTVPSPLLAGTGGMVFHAMATDLNAFKSSRLRNCACTGTRGQGW